MHVSTHILDTSRGLPAVDVAVTLQAHATGATYVAMTDADGRAAFSATEAGGKFRLVFDTAAYFERSGTIAFYPEVRVDFTVPSETARCHVPLLLSPFAYSTYRGS